MRRRFILKFISVFFMMTAASTIIWEEFVDEKVYDCTDPGFGYLNLPGGGWPLVVVKHIVANRPIGDPDNILEGWSVGGLWCLSGAFFAVSLIVSFLLARMSWSLSPRGQHRAK
jgi:hypothetical protein